jgi:YVTN family beta-propeller protein
VSNSRKLKPVSRTLPLIFLSLTVVSFAAPPKKKATAAKAHTVADFNAVVSSDPLPGMPPVLDPKDLYSADRTLLPVAKTFLPRVYVPNSDSNTIDVIDPATFKVVDHFEVGHQPQHVVPSWDSKTLWILNDLGDSLTKLDPVTGKKGETVPVTDPYNMYYTPDGKFAIVVAEAKKRLDFREPATMKLVQSVTVPCSGVDHVDFSASGRYFLASCEFSGQVLKIDVAEKKLAGLLTLNKETTNGPKTTNHINMNGAMPQDVKISPDGKVFYIADMMSDGVHLVDGETMKKIGFISTGKGAHGLYPSRDSKFLYVSNRDEGSVTVIDFATRKIVKKWQIPGGGSPDMGGVSADGKILWLSGRYSSAVYAIDTSDGKLLAKVPVGRGPHGLCVYPQPGRYSLGHTGIFR